MTTPATILIDLRGAQFDGDRGIPAYAQSLTAELIGRSNGHRWLLLHDPCRPPPPRASELAGGGTWCTATDLDHRRSPRIDAVLTGCFFLPDHRCGPDKLWPAWLARQRPRWTGIVYDLVPLLFPARYLSRPRARRHYLDALRLLRRSDHLFTISHATRRDTIRHAAVDPARITCIYGDIDQRKRQLMQLPATATTAVPARYGLRGPYCVCIGGDDWRKNMAAAVHGFAAFRANHPNHQLAIVCKLSTERIAELEQLAAGLGLPAGAVVCTGFVPDDHLVGLVRHATLLVYPSLYEGLGLPVLEAYGCGTPAVGSNTSSVAELILPELTCDPEDPASIAGAMHRATTDQVLRSRGLAFGRRLFADELGWDRAADRVLESLLPGSRRRLAPAAAADSVAVVAALPPARTGIAAYTLRFLQSDRWHTTFYEANPAPRLAVQSGLLTTSRVLPVEVLPAALLRGRHQTSLFVLGNSSHHAKVLDAMFRTRGMPGRRLAYLHEAALDSLFRSWLGDERRQLPDAPPPATPPDWIARAVSAKPEIGRGLRLLAETADLDGLIVNSFACRELVEAVLGSLADRWTIDVAFLPVVPADWGTTLPPQDPATPGPRPLRVGSFGLAGDTKRLDLLAAAVTILGRRRAVKLVIAGWEARRYCRRTGLDRVAGIEVYDFPDDATLTATMRSVDVAVQLRSPTFGESSGVVSQLLALGRPVVVTEAGSFAELPAELAGFVAADCSADVLATAIEAAAAADVAGPRWAELLADRSPAAFTACLADILVTHPVGNPMPLSA